MWEIEYIRSSRPELFRSSLSRCSVEKLFWKFLQTYQENIQCAVLVLVNLQVSCLEELFYTYMSPPREFCSKFSERFQNWLIFFFYQGFLSQALTFHRAAVEGRKPSLFLSTTSTHSLTFRHLFATLHVRWPWRIFNRTACNHQIATGWDLPFWTLIIRSIVYDVGILLISVYLMFNYRICHNNLTRQSRGFELSSTIILA